MKRIAIAFLALLAVASLGVALWQSRRAAAANANASAEITRLREQLWDAEKKSKSLESQLAAARAATPAPPPVATAQASGRGGAAQQLVSAVLGNITSALDSPEARRLQAIQQRAQLDGRYAALFRRLNLPPEELEKFKSLLVDRQSSGLDVLGAARAQGIDPLSSPAEMRNLVRTMEAQVDNDIRSLLGDAGYEQYRTYDQTLPQRTLATQLEQRLSYSSAPLSPDQYEQVVQILATSSPTRTNNDDLTVRNFTTAVAGTGAGGVFINTADGAGLMAPATPITNDAINQAGSVLNPAQVAALQQIQQEQQAQQQMGAAVRQNVQLNFGGGRGGGGGGRAARGQ